MLTTRTKALLPVVILGSALLLVALLFGLRDPVEPRATVVTAPLVRTLLVEPRTVELSVFAHGTVAPRSESDLVPQVSGEVVWMSPSLVSGGFFEKGAALVRVDRADYEAELESARAAVARAASQLSRARKERERQQRLARRSAASESIIDDAENDFRVAEATLREANARLARAERDLDRTELRAPYAGRVREERLDVGQFVSRGAAVGRLYAVDFAEVRLPVPDRELAFIDLPLRGDAGPDSFDSFDSDDPDASRASAEAGPAGASREDEPARASSSVRESPARAPLVRLRAEFMGRQHEWVGRVVRTEGELDPRSRMIALVARVEDPYGRKAGASGAPLAVGLFVEAEIVGISVENAVVLPSTAALTQQGDAVYIVDAESRLRARPVRVVRIEPERVIIDGGVEAGDRIAVSPPRWAVEGMQVQTLPDRAPEPAAESDLAARPEL